MSWNNKDRLLSRCVSWFFLPGLIATTGLTAATFSGCGEKFTPPTVHPVKGQVLLADGKPLTTGVVVLVSKVAMEFPGKVESDGHFSIKTPAGDGAPEGEYRVRIEPEARGTAPGPVKKGPPNLPYPMKYLDESTSGLTATVKPGENTLEPFKLVPGEAKSATGRGPKK